MTSTRNAPSRDDPGDGRGGRRTASDLPRIQPGDAVPPASSRHAQHRPANRVLKIVAWSLIAVGVILFPLPIPFGALMIATGIAILGPNDPRLRNVFAAFARSIRRLRGSRSSLLRTIGRNGNSVLSKARRGTQRLLHRRHPKPGRDTLPR